MVIEKKFDVVYCYRIMISETFITLQLIRNL